MKPSAERIAEAARLRVELARQSLLAPLPGSLEVLRELRARGYGLGLVSDCAPDVPLVWPESPLAPSIDVPVFSCAVGFRKPNARIYTMAFKRLGVEPGRCLYVADGVGQELSGALASGMRTALIRVAYEQTYDTDRPEVLAWNGLELSTLRDVLVVAGEE